MLTKKKEKQIPSELEPESEFSTVKEEENVAVYYE